MIKTLSTALLVAGLALPAFSAGPDGQPEMQSKSLEALVGSAGQSHSYLGVDIKDITSERMTALKLKEERGVEVTMVDQDAPAGKAGLKEHDVIQEFNGTRVDSQEQLRRMIRETPPGRTVTLGVSRDGNHMKVTAQLVDRSKMAKEIHTRWPDPSETVPLPPDFPRNGPQMDVPGIIITNNYSRFLGVQTEGLTRQLGEYFGVKNGEGLLVRSVDKGSAAEKAGIKAGDVIVKAESEKLTDRSDLARVLRTHRQGGKINLGILRDRKEQTVTVELPPRGKDSSRLYFDLDEFRSAEGDLEDILLDSLDDMEFVELPSLSMMKLNNLGHTLAAIKLDSPEMKRAMQRAQDELKKAQKYMEQHKSDWIFSGDSKL